MRKILKKNLTKKLRIKRVRAALKRSGNLPRLSVFRSNTSMYAQLIDDTKGQTVASATFKEIKEKKKPVEKAFALGKLLAEKAKKAGVQKAVFDRGKYAYHGRVKAVAEGAREGGLKI